MVNRPILSWDMRPDCRKVTSQKTNKRDEGYSDCAPIIDEVEITQLQLQSYILSLVATKLFGITVSGSLSFSVLTSKWPSMQHTLKRPIQSPDLFAHAIDCKRVTLHNHISRIYRTSWMPKSLARQMVECAFVPASMTWQDVYNSLQAALKKQRNGARRVANISNLMKQDVVLSLEDLLKVSTKKATTTFGRTSNARTLTYFDDLDTKDPAAAAAFDIAMDRLSNKKVLSMTPSAISSRKRRQDPIVKAKKKKADAVWRANNKAKTKAFQEEHPELEEQRKPKERGETRAKRMMRKIRASADEKADEEVNEEADEEAEEEAAEEAEEKADEEVSK